MDRGRGLNRSLTAMLRLLVAASVVLLTVTLVACGADSGVEGESVVAVAPLDEHARAPRRNGDARAYSHGVAADRDGDA